MESYGFKAIGTDSNRGFGGLFLSFDPLIIILLYVSKLQVLCKNKQMYVFVVVP